MKRERTFFLLSIWASICLWSSGWAREAPLESFLPSKLMDGWEQVGHPQRYDRQTLFKRINGQAELFFKYGFVRSVSALYQNDRDEKDQVEVDLYDMGNVLQAFGIFSRFRNEDRSAAVGLESYFDETSLLFYQGRYFVMLYATQAEPPILKKMAMTISSQLPQGSSPPAEIHYFPKEGLKPGSMEYHPEGLMGHQFLKRGFVATYLSMGKGKDLSKSEQKEWQLFFAMFGSPGEAGKALDAYRTVVTKGGKIGSGPAVFGQKVLRGEDSSHGKILAVQRGSFLAGAIGFESEDEALQRLSELMKHLN